MATTKTTTSNYSQAHVDRWLRSKLLEIGERTTVFDRWADKSVMPQGLGNVVSWLRYNRLDMPLGTLTEATAPTAKTLSLSRVSATAAQHGVLAELSDRLQIETNHDVLRVGVGQAGEVMGNLRDLLYQEALIGGTNAHFSGSSVTSRDSLASGDVLDTEDILRSLNTLTVGDRTAGKAPRFSDGRYKGVMHPRAALDLRSDSVWNNTMIRQGREKMENSPFDMISWEGIDFVISDYMPVFENLGDPDSGADDEHDANFAFGDGGGSLADYVSITITRKHVKIGFEEGIYDTHLSGDLANGDDSDVDVDVPSNSNYVYNVYVGDDASAQATATSAQTLEEENVAADAQVTITDTSGSVSPPTQPASGVKVYPTYIFGRGAYGGVDISGGQLTPTISSGPSKSDPLDQVTKIGAKFYFASLILNDNFLVRIESASDFS